MCFKLRKKVMLLLLSVFVLIAMTPMMAFAADGNPATTDDLNTAISNISSNAGKSGTITLGADITDNVGIPAGDNITLDLNGHKLTASANNHTIVNSGTLTINDSSTAKSGEVNCNEATHSAIQNEPGAVLTLNGGKYTKTSSGITNTDYYVITNHGTATINKGVSVISTCANASAVENGWYDGTKGTTDPTMTVNGGTFTGGMNTFKNDDRGTLVINDGTFANTVQVPVLSWNNTTINGGTFTPSDKASAAISTGYMNGGMDNGVTTITGGTFNSGLIKNPYSTDLTKVKYIISGGTFSAEPDSSYIASGYNKNKSGSKWIVSLIPKATTTTTPTKTTPISTPVTVDTTAAVKNAVASTKVVKLGAKISKGKVKFSWSIKGTSLTGYQIYRSTKATKGFSIIKTVKTNNYTIKGLKKGKKYYFKVRGYKIVNNMNVYTSYTTVKIKTK